MSKNYYEILGVSQTATPQEIKKVYYKLAQKLHPDKPGGKKEAFQELVEAYEVLSNPTEKKNYNTAQERGIKYNVPSSITSSVNSGGKDYAEIYRQIQLRYEAATEINNFCLGADLRLYKGGYGDWNNKIWEIEFEELENYKNQLLDYLKKLKKGENTNSNPNTHHNGFHHKPNSDWDHQPNPNGSKEKCYVCLKWLNQAEIGWFSGGKFHKTPVCSPECSNELNKRNEKSDEPWQKAQQIESDIQQLKNELPGHSPQKADEIAAKIRKLEEKRDQILSGKSTNQNQGSETTNDTDKDQKPSSNPPLTKSSNGKTKNTPTEDSIKAEQTQKNNEYNESLNKAEGENATLEEKAEVIKKSGSVAGEETPEQQSCREKLEKELAEKDPSLANEALLGRIENNLKSNNLTLEDLPPEIQADLSKIKGNNKDTIIIININNINININKIGASKRIKKLEKEIKNLANANLEKIKELKEKLLKIIYGNNRYEQEYKQQAQSLLSQLESKQVQNPSDSEFPVGWVVGGGVLLSLALIGVVIIKRKKKKFSRL